MHHLHPGRGVGSSLGGRAPFSSAYDLLAALQMLALNRLDLEIDDVVRSVLCPASRQIWRLVRERLVRACRFVDALMATVSGNLLLVLEVYVPVLVQDSLLQLSQVLQLMLPL